MFSRREAVMGRRATLVSMILVSAVMGLVTAADAQDRKWEIEVHGGGMLATNPTDGKVTLPGPGQLFTVPPSAFTPVVPSSRRESSWYFGDGASLFNQVASALVAGGVAQFPGRIATLDPVLGRPLGERRRGGSIGARVNRVVTPRLSAELSVDYSLAQLQITEANSDAIEATR